MPSPKSTRKVQEAPPEKSRKNRLTERPSSFHGKLPVDVQETRMRRPQTVPDLLSGKNLAAATAAAAAGPDSVAKPKLTKLLLNVTIQGSCGAIQVVISPETTVGLLIAAAIKQYSREGRRPFISTTDPSKFHLHYSQFSLESLEREEKLMALGSRNFYLCLDKSAVEGGNIQELSRPIGGSVTAGTASPSSCSKEVGRVGRITFPWLKFMDFLL